MGVSWAGGELWEQKVLSSEPCSLGSKDAVQREATQMQEREAGFLSLCSQRGAKGSNRDMLTFWDINFIWPTLGSFSVQTDFLSIYWGLKETQMDKRNMNPFFPLICRFWYSGRFQTDSKSECFLSL